MKSVAALRQWQTMKAALQLPATKRHPTDKSRHLSFDACREKPLPTLRPKFFTAIVKRSFFRPAGETQIRDPEAPGYAFRRRC
jgi:hypothetical protein